MTFEDDVNVTHGAPRRAADEVAGGVVEAANGTLDSEVMDAEEWLDWFKELDDAYKQEQRDKLLISGLVAGLTLQALGDLYNLSRERVRQITGQAGVNARDLKIKRAEQAARRERHLARRVYGMSLSFPELDVDEIAEAFECDVALVLRGLGNRKGLHQKLGPAGDPHRTSEADLLEALRQWANQTTRTTGDDFTAWATAHGIPGKQTVSIRFGSWNNALERAGLSHLVATRGGPRPHLDDATLWATLYEFFTSDAEYFTAQGYEAWVQGKDRASLATLRNRLGTWNEMWRRTRELLRYAANRDGTWEWAEDVLAIIPAECERKIVSPEQCLQALQEVAARVTGAVTVQKYEAVRSNGQPAAIVVQNKWGSWIRALHMAGLDDRMSGKARGRVARGEVVL